MGAQQSSSFDTQQKASMVSLEDKILEIIKQLNIQQFIIQGIYNEEKDFKPFVLNDMNTYMKVADKLGTEWCDPLLNTLMEECKAMWLDKIYPEAHAKKNLLKDDRKHLANFGKMLAGIAFIFGDYHLGLTYLVTAHELQPDNAFVYGAVLKWSCLLGEFGIFKMYEQNHHLCPPDRKGVYELQCVGRLFCEFFGPVHLTSREIVLTLKCLKHIKKKLLSLSNATHESLYARQLLHHICGVAALMPGADAHGDYNYHMKMAAECSLTALTSNIDNIFESETSLKTYRFTLLSESLSFLTRALEITDYFVTEKAYCQALLESGCMHDCETRILLVFYFGTKVFAPLRVLEPLNMLHYIKLRTENDHDKLTGIRALTSLLIGRAFEDSARTVASPFRSKLLEVDYSFPIPKVDQSFTVTSLVSTAMPFDRHFQSCNCFLCYEMMFNPNFGIQICYSNSLLDNLSYLSCTDEIDEMNYLGFILLQNAQDKLYQVLEIKDQLKYTVSALSFVKDICVILCNCLLIDSSMPSDDRVLLCNTIIKHANLYPFHLRSYWLLARQFKRKFVCYEKYPWLRHPTNDDMNIKEILEWGSDPFSSTSNETIEVLEAEKDFKLYGHIFAIDWRRRICVNLGAAFVGKDPWKSAFYFIESLATSLREYLRVIKKRDLRFLVPFDFQHAVRKLFPKDFTYVQLILDDHNVLWLIRCTSNYDPVIVPVVQISSLLEDIPNRFYNILVENDLSCKQPYSPTYWTSREHLEYKLQQLILDIENGWLRRFKGLLVPFANADEKMAAKVDDIKEFLMKNGIHSERAKFLAMLFFHVDDDDFSFILRVFCLLQQDLFTSMKDALIPENICYELFANVPNRDSFINKEEEKKKNKYVVLALSQELSPYPWECLPIFIHNVLVTRIQSMHFFFNLLGKYQYKLPISVHTNDSYLFLDPSSDLRETEGRIKGELKIRQSSFSASNQEQFLECIKEYDIFLFIGHGNGGFNNASLRGAQCRTIPILMGCSSVRIQDEGRGFDGVSVVHDYLIAGAPSVIGCNWMVSDRELDIYFFKFVELCASEWSNQINRFSFNLEVVRADPSVRLHPFRHMIKAMVEARKACRLPLLTGAAVVAYGLPAMADPAPLEAYFESRSDIKKDFNNNLIVNQ